MFNNLNCYGIVDAPEDFIALIRCAIDRMVTTIEKAHRTKFLTGSEFRYLRKDILDHFKTMTYGVVSDAQCAELTGYLNNKLLPVATEVARGVATLKVMGEDNNEYLMGNSGKAYIAAQPPLQMDLKLGEQ